MSQVWSAPVRFVECDMQGIVFNAHYLVWADEALTPWWTEQGIDWRRFGAEGFQYVVVASTLEWRSSARHGETVTVDADLEKLGRTSLTVRFEIRVGDRLCCTVRTTYVCLTDGAPTAWPDDLRARLAA
ncbi:acyl-CoA thioesterase [Candidatus Blastococcus massiliensis]|uniref:acyl-CoA thioesterase n=1 Tax=Candidatus Blastococcus massiliensis TaxID=1470358 RepID=UPI0004B026D6|nr:thioesterase family protein [Candidatus Blastococcus massiliensis]